MLDVKNNFVQHQRRPEVELEVRSGRDSLRARAIIRVEEARVLCGSVSVDKILQRSVRSAIRDVGQGLLLAP